MNAKRSVRGRQQLAQVASVDAAVTFVVLLLLPIALDDFVLYDFLPLAIHALHILSVLIGYVFARHSTTSLETLRVLTITYFILFVLDASVIVVLRVLMWGHHYHADTGGEHMPALGTLVSHMIVSVLFVLIDVSGAYLCMVTQHALLAVQYSNDQLQSMASASLYKAQANENV